MASLGSFENLPGDAHNDANERQQDADRAERDARNGLVFTAVAIRLGLDLVQSHNAADDRCDTERRRKQTAAARREQRQDAAHQSRSGRARNFVRTE